MEPPQLTRGVGACWRGGPHPRGAATDLTEKGFRLRLNVIEALGFGDYVDNTNRCGARDRGQQEPMAQPGGAPASERLTLGKGALVARVTASAAGSRWWSTSRRSTRRT